MPFDRRSFLKILGLTSGSLLLRPLKGSAAIRPQFDTEIAVLYDSSKCVGCKACQNACKRVNHLPPEVDPTGIYDAPMGLSEKTWSLVELAKKGDPHPFFFARCFHCTDASCVNVCPTGACYHLKNGAVIIDQNWCIGCGYCAQACPFGVPHLGLGKEKATSQKCILCFRLLKKSEPPACVANCTTGALSFGPRKDMVLKGRKKVDELRGNGYPNANLYGDTELEGMHHLSILLDKPSVYGLPEHPKVSTSIMAKSWLSGFLGVVLIPVLIMPFWLSNKKNNKSSQNNKSQEG